MLFYSFEEQFDTPAITVKFRDKGCRSLEIIGEVDVFCAVYMVNGDDFAEFFGVVNGTSFINRESACIIRNEVYKKSPFRGTDLEPHIGFCSYNRESLNAIYGEKILKIVVAFVEVIMGTNFIRDFVHHLRVMNIGWQNRQELVLQHLKSYVILYLFRVFGIWPIQRPTGQAHVDGGGITGIDMMIKLKNLLESFFASLFNHVKCALFEDTVITLLISFA